MLRRPITSFAAARAAGASEAEPTPAPPAWEVLAPADDPRDPLATMHLIAALPDRPTALEIVGEHGRLRLLARASDAAAGRALAGALYAAFPQAQLRPVAADDDPARRAGPGERGLAREMTLRAPESFPLRLVERDDAERQGDPLAVLLRACDGLGAGERLLLRLTLRPAPPGWAGRYLRAAEARARPQPAPGRTGGAPAGGDLPLLALALLALAGLVAWRRGTALPPPPAAAWAALTATPLPPALLLCLLLAALALALALVAPRLAPPALPPGDLLADKLRTPGCLARLHLLAWGPDPGRLAAHLDRAAATLRLYARADGNALVARRARPDPRLPRLRLRPVWRAPVLSAAELAGLWGPVGGLADAGDLVRAGAARRRPHRTGPDGRPWLADGPPLGVSDQGGVAAPVCFPAELLAQPTLILGKTGTGKSTALGHLLAHAMADARRAVVLIDPHGDLADAVLGLVPPGRRAAVVAVDLADPDHAVGFNLLDATTGRPPEAVVADLLGSLKRLWPDTWGPRMELMLRHAALVLAHANRALPADGQFTILHVEPLLQVADFRRTVLDDLCDGLFTRAWWASYYDRLSARDRDEYINPVLTKMALFSTMPTARRVLGQPRSTLDLAATVLGGGIVVVKLAKGRVKADLAGLVGALLGEYVDLAIESQAGRPPAARRPVLVAVDELQVVPIDYERMLRELRKYGGGFLLCTQEFGSLEAALPGLRSLFFGNVAGLLCFRVAEAEGRLLAGELDDRFTPLDLANLPRGVCAAKLSAGGRPVPAFSLRVHPPPPADPALVAGLWRAGGRRWGTPVAEVDALIERGGARVIELAGLAAERRARAAAEDRPADAATPATPVTPAADASPPARPVRAAAVGRPGGTRRSRRRSGDAAPPVAG